MTLNIIFSYLFGLAETRECLLALEILMEKSCHRNCLSNIITLKRKKLIPSVRVTLLTVKLYSLSDSYKPNFNLRSWCSLFFGRKKVFKIPYPPNPVHRQKREKLISL